MSLIIVKVNSPAPEPGETEISFSNHKHPVIITNTETGAIYEELSSPPEPLEGETIATLNRHRHNTTAGYTSTAMSETAG